MVNPSVSAPAGLVRSLVSPVVVSAAAVLLAAGAARAGDLDVGGRGLLGPIQGVRQFSGQIVVKPKPSASLDIKAIAPGSEIVGIFPETGELILRVPKGADDARFAAQLSASGKFQYAEPDWLVFPQGNPNDTLFSSQWHHQRINDPAAWSVWTGAPAITVAVVDSGVDFHHPDLAAVMVSGYNAVSKLTQAAGGDVSDVSNQSHGTAVAGCVGAIGNNGVGVAGVAWNLRIMPVRASNEPTGSAVLSTVLAGCRWAADNGAKVINASYSGVNATSVQTTGAYVRDRNGILVWASGNNGSYLGSSVDWPDVFIVGATGQDDQRPAWGNYGPALDVVAPGLAIMSTEKNASYGLHEGTSFSSPIAAGVIGLAWSVAPSATRAQVLGFVQNSAMDLGAPGADDTYGLGMVNAYGATLAAWRASHVFQAPITDLADEGPVNQLLWPVHPARNIKTIYFGDDLNAAALEMRGGDVLESSTIDLSALDPTRTQLRVWTFQAGNAELVAEYLNSDGVWSYLIDSASTIDGPHEHAWVLPVEAVHAGFALRFTCSSSNGTPLYLSTMSVAERCNADFDDSGFVDTDDFTVFVNAFESGSSSADVDFSGFVDTDDFTSFVLSFSEGC